MENSSVISLKLLIQTLEGAAANVDTDCRWRAATVLREWPQWETATITLKNAENPSRAPKGMVLVPLEPTLEMCIAAFNRKDREETGIGFGDFAMYAAIYKVMLAASESWAQEKI